MNFFSIRLVVDIPNEVKPAADMLICMLLTPQPPAASPTPGWPVNSLFAANAKRDSSGKPFVTLATIVEVAYQHRISNFIHAPRYTLYGRGTYKNNALAHILVFFYIRDVLIQRCARGDNPPGLLDGITQRIAPFVADLTTAVCILKSRAVGCPIGSRSQNLCRRTVKSLKLGRFVMHSKWNK